MIPKNNLFLRTKYVKNFLFFYTQIICILNILWNFNNGKGGKLDFTCERFEILLEIARIKKNYFELIVIEN